MKKSMALLAVLLALLCACGKAGATWQEQYDLGVRYLSEGNYQEAIIAFEAAIEIDPARAEAYAQLAEVYLAMDDPEQAARILEQGIEATGDARLQSRLDELRGPEPEPEPDEPEPSGPQTVREELGGGAYRLYFLDEEEQLIRDETYGPDGILRYANFYEEPGQPPVREDYNPDGSLESYTTFLCNEAGETVRSDIYEPDGSQRGYSLFFHTDTGERKREDHLPDGALMWAHYFDAAGNETMTEWYASNGALEYIAYYDETGYQTRAEWYSPDGTLEYAEDY